MIKLPVCPHCKTVYRYKEVVKNSQKKEIECYHCGNKFRNSYIKTIIPAVTAVVTGIVIDTIILNLTGTFSKSIIPLIAVSWVVIFLAVLISPFFFRYAKIAGQPKKPVPKKPIVEKERLNKRQKRR